MAERAEGMVVEMVEVSKAVRGVLMVALMGVCMVAEMEV